MAMFFQCMDTIAPGALDTMSADQIKQLEAIFMQEIATNQVIRQELEERMSQAVAAQQGGTS